MAKQMAIPDAGYMTQGNPFRGLHWGVSAKRIKKVIK